MVTKMFEKITSKNGLKVTIVFLVVSMIVGIIMTVNITEVFLAIEGVLDGAAAIEGSIVSSVLVFCLILWSVQSFRCL